MVRRGFLVLDMSDHIDVLAILNSLGFFQNGPFFFVVGKYGFVVSNYDENTLYLQQTYDNNPRVGIEWHFDTLERQEKIPTGSKTTFSNWKQLGKNFGRTTRELIDQLNTPPVLPRINRILSSNFTGFDPLSGSGEQTKDEHHVSVKFLFPEVWIRYENDLIGIHNEYKWDVANLTRRISTTRKNKPVSKDKTFSTTEDLVLDIRQTAHKLSLLVAGELERVDSCVRCFSLATNFKCQTCGATYCDIECQTKDWHRGHQEMCK